MSLIWITTSLSSDGEGTVNRTEHDGCYDCSPAGKLGCLITAFVRAVGHRGDDATSDEDQ